MLNLGGMSILSQDVRRQDGEKSIWSSHNSVNGGLGTCANAMASSRLKATEKTQAPDLAQWGKV